MSVAIFTDNDFDKTNGVTTTLKALLRHAPPDLRVRIYTLADYGVNDDGYLALPSVSAPIPFYSEMRMYLPRMRQLRRHLNADGIQMIHLTTPGPAGLAARYFARRSGRRIVGSFHTNLGDYTTVLSGSRRLGACMDAYMRWLYGACEAVFAPSIDTIDRLVARRWDGDRLLLWRRGVDTTVFSPERRSRELRERWRVCDRRRPAMLYAGRLSHEKGLALFERLCSLLCQFRVEHRLIFVGDGPMAGELRQRHPDAVFTGTLPHQDVAVAMASADVLVFPSTTDTAGNVVLEAQAAGLPVVVSDAGGPRENMLHGSTGYVCRAGDASDFCGRVAELLRDPVRRAQLSNAARRYAQTRTWPLALEPVYSLYRSVETTRLLTSGGGRIALANQAASRV